MTTSVLTEVVEDPASVEVFQFPGKVTVWLGAVPVILAAGIS